MKSAFERFLGRREEGLKFIPLTLTDFPFRLDLTTRPADGEFGTNNSKGCFQSPRPSRCYRGAGLFKMAAMVKFQKDLTPF